MTVSLALLRRRGGPALAGSSPRGRTSRHGFLTILLGLATFAGALLSVVYLPVKARFVTDQDFGTPRRRWATFHSLLLDWGCPTPGPGALARDRGGAR